MKNDSCRASVATLPGDSGSSSTMDGSTATSAVRKASRRRGVEASRRRGVEASRRRGAGPVVEIGQARAVRRFGEEGVATSARDARCKRLLRSSGLRYRAEALTQLAGGASLQRVRGCGPRNAGGASAQLRQAKSLVHEAKSQLGPQPQRLTASWYCHVRLF